MPDELAPLPFHIGIEDRYSPKQPRQQEIHKILRQIFSRMWSNMTSGNCPRLLRPLVDVARRTGMILACRVWTIRYDNTPYGSSSRTGCGSVPGSPALDRGIAVTDNGGRDFTGRDLYNGKPDIVAFEGV